MISVISVNVLEGGTRLREAVSSAEHLLKDLTLEDCLSAALSVSKQWPEPNPVLTYWLYCKLLFQDL